MCPPACAVVGKGSSVTLMLLLGACEVKIWQKISGILDEWKVLNALGENLHRHNDKKEKV